MRRSLRSCFFALCGALSLAACGGYESATSLDDQRASAEGLLIELSNEAEAAINSGISLTLRCELAVLQEYWLFTRKLRPRNHRFVISRQSLSDRYVVKRDDLPTPHLFRSVQGASNYIATQALILLESNSDEANPYAMRLTLNKFDLPAPMRLNAFISQDWNLDTGWIQWQSGS